MPNTELSLPDSSQLSLFFDFLDHPDTFYSHTEKRERDAFLARFQEIRNLVVAELSRMLAAGESISQDFFQLLIEVKTIFVGCLTLLEDEYYRKRQPKSALRAALFNLSQEVGSTVVPGESVGFTPIIDNEYSNQEWAVLDYRKVGKPIEKQRGEIYEAVQAYAAWQESLSEDGVPLPDESNQSDSLQPEHPAWLAVIEEIGDVLFNNAQTIGAEKILLDLCQGNKDSKLFYFGLLLLQLAEYKFEHRYIFMIGHKEESREKNYISRTQKELDVDLKEVFDHYSSLIPEVLIRLTEINRAVAEEQARAFFNDEELKLFMSQLVSAEVILEMLNLPSEVQ